MIWTIIKVIISVGLVILAGIGAVSCILGVGLFSECRAIKKRNKLN